MLLITPSEVIAIAFTSREKITPDSIRPLKIDIAQEHYIRPRFGDQFFERMVGGLYGDFVEQYIKPALAQYVRYSLIDELAVQIGDNGAVIYGSTDSTMDKKEVVEQSGTLDQTTLTEGSSTDTKVTTDKTTDNYSKTVQGSEELTTDSSTASAVRESHTIENFDRGDSTSDLTSNQSATGTTESKLTGHNDTTSGRNGSTNEGRTNRILRSATVAERRVITARALSDANILLAKAVRYVERNIEQFSTYLPSTVSSRVFF